MVYLQPSFLIWGLALIQIVGLASAWLARMSEGSRSQVSCHRVFFCCLAMMGLTTMIALAVTPKYWLTSGTTLSLMVISAVWDFRPATNARSL